MKSYSKEAPNQVELIAPETYRVRWDIDQVVEEIEGKEVSQYTFEECTVPAPLTQDSILERAIRETVSQSQELKLINDFNASQLMPGVRALDVPYTAVYKYKVFIEWRDQLKAKINQLCIDNNIQ